MGGWDKKIYQVWENPVMFLWACCVPCGICCIQVLNAKKSDSDKNSPIIAGLCICCLGCIGATFNRYTLRGKLGVSSSIIFDILAWCFLPCCSAHQEWVQAHNKKLIWEVL